PGELLQSALDASRRFHALAPTVKQQISINRFHRGYIAPRSSLIRTSSVAEVKRPNLSESLMLMHEVSPTDSDYGQPLQGPNQWPQLENFREPIQAYDSAMRALCARLTRLISLALGQPADALTPYFEKPTTWLRLLRYPPHPASASADDFGSAPHTDYGFITVLAQDELSGLEVRDRDGQWLSATPIADTFVLNVADMLAVWSGGRWPSTPHRVRNFGTEARYSIPYFYDPQMNTRVRPLRDDSVRPVVFGDYVMERLDKNYQYRDTPSTAAG
ncbi:MAG: isopenicillin N synthase family oxygenase, partial [Gammaproteobacteria bacterium]|nr:isopenicillin N synthase family oxygenase [Gammaproteobacteria bacterium]